MEVVELEEQEDFDELYAEILAKWTSPINSHQNPVSMLTNLEQAKIDRVSNGSLHAAQPEQASSCNNKKETKNSTLYEPKHEDPTEDIELEQGDEIMKTCKTTSNEEGSGYKQDESVGMDRPVIPVLVADTFYDKLLGRGVDGIDITTLNKVKEAKKYNEDGDKSKIILNETKDAGASPVSTNNGKEMEKLSYSQSSSGLKYNFPIFKDRMPKGSPVCVPGSAAAALTKSRICSERGFAAKPVYMLPPNKTIFDINIDDFGEKLWRNPGLDTSDFFNYELDEKHWTEYCKLMQAQVRVGSSGQCKTNADENRQSQKNEEQIGGLKSNRGIDECLLMKDSKDLSFHDSDVIIEIVMSDSFHENELRRGHIKCRLINGDDILPFPMDSYSPERRDETEQKKKKTRDAHLIKQSRERKTDFSENNYIMRTNIHGRIEATNMDSETLAKNTCAYRKIKQNYDGSYDNVKVTSCNEPGNQHSSRKQREHSGSHYVQRNSQIERRNQTRVKESAREKMENCVYEGVPKVSARGIGHNSEIADENEEKAIINSEEDLKKLERRKERFKHPLPIVKSIVAEKSMERESNSVLIQGIANIDSYIKYQCPSRRRKWTSS